MTKPDAGITLSTLLQAAVQCHQAGNLQEAERHCLRICTVAPNLPDALHLLAIIYAQTGHYQAANDNFSPNSAIQKDDVKGSPANLAIR